MKLHLNWQHVVLGSVVTVTVGALAWKGILPSSALTGLLGAIAGWLVPSPVVARREAPKDVGP